MIEGSVPPFIVRKKHSPNLSPLCLQYLTIPVRLYNCRQSSQRERLGECFLRTTKGGTDPSITNKYSLLPPLSSFITYPTVLTLVPNSSSLPPHTSYPPLPTSLIHPIASLMSRIPHSSPLTPHLLYLIPCPFPLSSKPSSLKTVPYTLQYTLSLRPHPSTLAPFTVT